MASSIDNCTQRILRVLLTAAGDYIWHTGYGIGAGKYVGKGLSPQVLQQIKAAFRGQILSDPDVASNPPPALDFNTKTANVLAVTITYTYAPTGKPQTLSFNVST